MNALVHLTSDAIDDRAFARLCAVVLEENEALDLEDITLLAHRDGVWLVAEDSPQRDEVAELIERGVTVKAGASCLDARDIPREVVPGVELVPSGVVELIRLQSRGYHYVKVP